MNLDAIWPSLALMALVFSLVSLPSFRSIDEPPQAGARSSTIDGLRGFLAFSVFIFHFRIMREFIQTGIWDIPPTRYYALLGPVPVSLFFMITGYLFWGKVLRSQGCLNWRSLYIGRLFRISPLYLFVVLCMLAIVFSRTGFVFVESATDIAIEIAKWLALGVIYSQPDVNGYRASHVLAGVTWTIAYEWMFYASLFLTAFFVRKKLELPLLVGTLAVALVGKLLFHIDAMGFAVLFVFGMAIASLLHRKIVLKISNTWSSTAAALLLLTVFSIGRTGYDSISAVLLAAFFYLICSGATLFGLLATRAAHRLGNISYSIYLLQGLILTGVFSSSWVRDFAMTSALNFWLVGALSAALLTLAACATYLCIEKPGIDLGRTIAQRNAKQAPPLRTTLNASSPIATTHESEAGITLAEKSPSY